MPDNTAEEYGDTYAAVYRRMRQVLDAMLVCMQCGGEIGILALCFMDEDVIDNDTVGHLCPECGCGTFRIVTRGQQIELITSEKQIILA